MHGLIMLYTQDGQKYSEGDVLASFNGKRISRCHGDMICSHRHAGLNAFGLRPDGASKLAYDATYQLGFDRVSTREVIRKETDIDGNILNQDVVGDFLLFKDNLGGTHQIYSRVGNTNNPEKKFIKEISQALGVQVQTCQITKIRTIPGEKWQAMLITDTNGNAINGCEIRMERMDVEAYLKARIKHHAHRIFGSDKSEKWHGGRTDFSQAATDKVWEITHNHTNHVLNGFCPECGREHEYWPAGSREIYSFLLISTEDFTDEESEALTAPVMERIPNNTTITDRNGVDISSVISKLRRYPGYDPRIDKIVQAVPDLDGNGDQIVIDGRPQYRKTIIDVADVDPLPESELLSSVSYGGEDFQWDDDTNEIQIKRRERDIQANIGQELLDDIQETIDKVKNINIPIGNVKENVVNSPIFGSRPWIREKTQPLQVDRARLYSVRDKQPLPPKGQNRGQ